MHCNSRQPDAAQALCAVISSPVPSVNLLVWTRSAYLLRFYCLYVTLRCDFELWTRDHDLWSWTFVVCRLCHGQTLYQIWAKLGNSRRSYCSLNIWPYDLEHLSRIVLCSGIVCTNFKLIETICSWNVTIFMLIRYYTLWRWPLTRWRWKFVVDLVSCRHSLY